MEAMKARSAALSAGAAPGESAARAEEVRKPRATRARKSPRVNFFMLISFLNEARPRGRPPRISLKDWCEGTASPRRTRAGKEGLPRTELLA
jgi:hypothetical protein